MQELFDFLDQLMESGEYVQLKEELNSEQPANVAEYFEELTAEKQLFVFRLLTKDMAAEVFSYMDSDTQEHIVHSITDREVRNIVDEMFLDDTVDFLEEAPANLVKKVLRNTDAETRKLINRFLNYPENSAGSLMTIEFVKLRSNITVANAMKQIKRTGTDKETIYTCYVIDNKRKLIGVVPLRTLICASDDETIEELMQEDVVSVLTTDDQEEVANSFKKYNWMALPVTDTEGRLVGIITVDDIVDVIDRETTEDMEKMAALLPSDEEYLKTPVMALAKNRIPWLSVLMISGTLSSFVIVQYNNLLEIAVVLSGFIPIITGTGGNAGSQASTMIIRGMALGEIEIRDAIKVVWKEIRVGVLCGFALGLLNMLKMTLINRDTGFLINLSVSLSMAAVVVLAKTIGCILPILAKALKFDPAMMAGPLISTVVDAVALVIYFSIATILVL
ncbi:magnesium transporter [Anaerotignum sp.]|uniref:magnesium transporter n=1 Tax=Anaerotignum sp. TaxID=2039241 RepID=UPI00271537A1|nr:magnesium transporter [Anaerotignum sp.]